MRNPGVIMVRPEPIKTNRPGVIMLRSRTFRPPRPATTPQHRDDVRGETPVTRRGGPTPYLRLDLMVKCEQGMAVWRLVARGASIRQAAQALGLSPTTAWRRVWFVRDWYLPRHYGRPMGPIPPQRGTRACPNGRPYLPTMDGVWNR